VAIIIVAILLAVCLLLLPENNTPPISTDTNFIIIKDQNEPCLDCNNFKESVDDPQTENNETFCGDTICNREEDIISCPVDCELNTPPSGNIEQDGAVCGNRICEASESQNGSCDTDCK